MLNIFLGRFVFSVWNMGITAGLILGCMLLLRPVLVRVLTAQQRAWLGMVGWYGTAIISVYNVLGWIHLLPVTFRDLITPRTGGGGDLPTYLPGNYWGPGEYAVALPGGKAVWVELSDGIVIALALLWIGVVVALTLWLTRRSDQMKALGRQGQLLADDDLLLFRSLSRRPEDKPVGVRLCRGLPTSFVYQNGEKINGKRYNMIYLQEELSPQRRVLVLRHEWNHIRLHHGWMKLWASALLILFWWNPILWAAYYFFCRDLEMACDEKTLDDLTGPEERKQYAQTLVDLAAGKLLWDVPLAFGECGAVPRVKAVVAWHEPREWVKNAKWCAFVLVFLFFVGGPQNIPYLPQELVRYWQEEAVEVEVPDSWTPAERWMRADPEGYMTLLARDTQGNWYKQLYMWRWKKQTFYGSGGWSPLSEPPDLTGFQQGLW